MTSVTEEDPPGLNCILSKDCSARKPSAESTETEAKTVSENSKENDSHQTLRRTTSVPDGKINLNSGVYFLPVPNFERTQNSEPGESSPQGSKEPPIFLTEFAPLTHILSQIPQQAQRGLQKLDIRLTCLDVLPDYIALGSSIGTVFLYDRHKDSMLRLKCGDVSDPITSLSLVLSVDYMLAAGCQSGQTVVYQIPVLGTNSKMERYLVQNVHHHSVTALVWSPNAMKLFSGDSGGLIACTEIDYDQHISKTREIFLEKYPIVQIDYVPQILLVSTTQRTVVCHLLRDELVVQLGHQDRKCLGNFGACFNSSSFNRRDISVFASRPAMRMWKGSVEGIVLETFLLKDLLLQNPPSLRLLSLPKQSSLNKLPESQFGPVLLYDSKYLITWNLETIFIIDPTTRNFIAVCPSFVHINGVACTKDEIFVLQGKRHLMRIARHPEDIKQDSKLEETNFFQNLATPFAELTSVIRDRRSSETPSSSAFQIFDTSIPVFEWLKKSPINNQPPTALEDSTSTFLPISSGPTEIKRVTMAPGDTQEPNSSTVDSPVPLPPVVQLEVSQPLCTEYENAESSEHIDSTRKDSDSKSSSSEPLLNGDVQPSILANAMDTHRTGALYSKVFDTEEEDDIVYRKTKKKKKKTAVPQLDLATKAAPETVPKEIFSSLAPPSNRLSEYTSSGSTHSEPPIPSYDEIFSSSATTDERRNLSVDALSKEKNHKPPPYSPDDEILFRILKRFNESQQQHQQDSDDASSRLTEEIPAEKCPVQNFDESSDSHSTLSESDPSCADENVVVDSKDESALDFDIYCHQDQDISPPQTPDSPRPSSFTVSSDSKDDKYKISNDYQHFLEPSYPEYSDNWVQTKGPGSIVSLAISDKYLCCVDSKDVMYFMKLSVKVGTWTRASRPAQQISTSPSGDILWVLYKDVLYAGANPVSNEPLAERWIEITENVVSMSVTENSAWFVKGGGEVFMQDGISPGCPATQSTLISCHNKIVQVSAYDEVVWALTSQGTILARRGICKNKPEGTDWAEVVIPVRTAVNSIALGCNCTGWMIDNDGRLWFKANIKSNMPGGYNRRWWEVDLNEPNYQNASSLPTSLMKMKNLTSVLNPEKISNLILGHSRASLVAGKHGVWFCDNMSSHIYSCRRTVIGYHWERIGYRSEKMGPSRKLSLIKNHSCIQLSAGGVYQEQGVVWALFSTGELLTINPVTRKTNLIELPDSISVTCLAPAPESLWALSSSGEIIVRLGQSLECPAGDSWVKLNLMQLGGLHLIHLSCNHEVVWACDSRGVVYMRLGSLKPPGPHTLPPAWVPVDAESADEAPHISVSSSGDKPFSLLPRFLRPHLVKIYVGPESYMVWAVDSKKRVYVREGIYPELLIGISWVEVPGIQAKDLCLSERAVWAITSSGEVYRRFGISNTSFIGDYWKKIPGHVSSLSATVDDKLWAVNPNGHITHLTSYTLPYQPDQSEDPSASAVVKKEAEADGWEVV